MKKFGRRTACAVALVTMIGGIAHGAVQLEPTKFLVLKNASPERRTIGWKVSVPQSSSTVVGDLQVGGAKLRLALFPGGDQCVSLPGSSWKRIGVGLYTGFKYKDAPLNHGPVKQALIWQARARTFMLKVLMRGSGITVVPGNPTNTYALNFTIGGGDTYCSGSATATPDRNDVKTFKIQNDTTPGGCVVTACSPSGAFLDPSPDPF